MYVLWLKKIWILNINKKCKQTKEMYYKIGQHFLNDFSSYIVLFSKPFKSNNKFDVKKFRFFLFL